MIRLLCHPECAYCWPYCEHRLVAQCEREWREHETEEDRRRELELAAEHLGDVTELGADAGAWPWYAEPGWEVDEEAGGVIGS